MRDGVPRAARWRGAVLDIYLVRLLWWVAPCAECYLFTALESGDCGHLEIRCAFVDLVKYLLTWTAVQTDR